MLQLEFDNASLYCLSFLRKVVLMIITIDGPAGAGKSSAARALAKRLGYRFLDTGSMYRAVVLAARQRGHDWDDDAGLVALAKSLSIEVTDDVVLLDGRDVTREIRTFEITTLTYHAADNPGVRGVLVGRQREAVKGHHVVTEGRDQGTVVFPEAQCKIFLTATDEERARRRLGDLLARGEQVTFDEVLAKQRRRDERDRNRTVGPLIKATDAIEVVTDGMSAEQVVCRLEALVRSRLT